VLNEEVRTGRVHHHGGVYALNGVVDAKTIAALGTLDTLTVDATKYGTTRPSWQHTKTGQIASARREALSGPPHQ
jgi:hypothetical protein